MIEALLAFSVIALIFTVMGVALVKSAREISKEEDPFAKDPPDSK